MWLKVTLVSTFQGLHVLWRSSSWARSCAQQKSLWRTRFLDCSEVCQQMRQLGVEVGHQVSIACPLAVVLGQLHSISSHQVHSLCHLGGAHRLPVLCLRHPDHPCHESGPCACHLGPPISKSWQLYMLLLSSPVSSSLPMLQVESWFIIEAK